MKVTKWEDHDVEIYESSGASDSFKFGDQFPWICAEVNDCNFVVPCYDVDDKGEWAFIQVGIRLSTLVSGFLETEYYSYQPDDLNELILERDKLIRSFENAIGMLKNSPYVFS